MLKIAKGFQTSVNIAYDLHDDEKIRSFIPTQSSLDVIEDVLHAISPTSTQRSRVLIGSYGRGKSHIVLVLLSLLFKKDKNLFTNLLKKIKKTNPTFYELTLEYLSSDQKILPIVVRGNSTSLTQSFLVALDQILKEEGLSDLMPETHFQAAASKIKNWKNNYPSTFKNFKSLITRTSDNFILALEEYDASVYQEFVQLYPTLTSGSVFNPFFGFDVIDLFENVATKIRDKGFTGIFVVYDEFSKYLESSIARASNSDIKLLQDFAEKCDRSGASQMHLMLISHKDISNYIDSNLPKDKVDGWRGVSGRFKHLNLHNNYMQMYEIISEVIQKDIDSWEIFKEKHKHRFDELKERFTNNGLLNKNDKVEYKNAIEGCFPLHPVTTFILPRLSEKVAQNERTLFTFLSAQDKYTLSSFLKHNRREFSLLTPEVLYDYFEPLLRKEPRDSETYAIYRLTSTVLNKVEPDTIHSKILKTLSLIYLVEQFEKLPPYVDLIVDTFKDSVNDQQEIHIALKELIEKDCLVYLKRSNFYLKIKETSGENIPEEIDRFIQKKLSSKSVTDILNESTFESYMYPTEYNDKNSIIRYFDFLFIDSDDYCNTKNWDKRIADSDADGVIFAIIPKNLSEISDLKNSILSQKKTNKRMIFVLPKDYMDITKYALEYAAVVSLKEESQGDVVLSDEYDIYLEDLSEVIGTYITNYTRPENSCAEYFYQDLKQNLYRKAHLSNLLSSICYKVFAKTPIINNESINKNEISPITITSRTKILKGLLENELEPYLGLTGSGQDVSIMRSTLIQTGILVNADSSPAIDVSPPDKKMCGMLSEIRIFFTEKAAKKGGVEFQTLYDSLTSHKNGIGLKRGVIPIYIATVLHLYKKNLVILYCGNEVKITPELLNDINESPNHYSVILEDWDEKKANYIVHLESLFQEYAKENEKAYNVFTYLCLAMNHWYIALPKYAKEMTITFDSAGTAVEVETAFCRFLNNLKQLDLNPREFLFEKAFSIFGATDYAVIVDKIREVKLLYDNALEHLLNALIQNVKTMFSDSSIDCSLTSSIKDWYESLNERTLKNLFTNNENKILGLMASITNDEIGFIKKLAKSISYLRVEDWNNETYQQFMKELEIFKDTIDRFNQNKALSLDDNFSCEITFIDENGKKNPKHFTRISYSNRARLLLNEMKTHLEEYGRSITEQEKRQVLIELLEKLC